VVPVTQLAPVTTAVPALLVIADSPETRVVQRQLSAYGAQDLEAFLTLFSPTAQVLPVDGSQISGRRALREYYGAQVANDRAWVEVETRLAEGEWVVDQQIIHGIAERPVRTIVVHRVQNGAVTEVRYLA